MDVSTFTSRKEYAEEKVSQTFNSQQSPFNTNPVLAVDSVTFQHSSHPLSIMQLLATFSCALVFSLFFISQCTSVVNGEYIADLEPL